jgi:hypothetical protein
MRFDTALWAFVLGIVACVPGCSTASPPSSGQAASSSTSPRSSATPAPEESIGVATMEPDGTIVLKLRATAPGLLGDAQLRYRRSDKDYAEVLKHLGGLHPGESKSVRPWPD